MKTKITVILLCFVAFQAVGQSVTDFERRLYNTYVDEKIVSWNDIISDMKKRVLEKKVAGGPIRSGNINPLFNIMHL